MRFLILGFILFLLAACGGEPSVTEEYAPVFAMTEYEPLPPGEGEVVYLDFIIEMLNQPFGRFERAEGVLLGAYIARDAVSGGDIRSFQDYMQVEHGIFAHTMRLGEPFPLRWVLDNIANHSTPLITLHPPQDAEMFDFEALETFARYAGMFNVPTFVELYPIRTGHGFLPLEHVNFFRHARGIFEQQAPNVALVWGIDTHNLAHAKHFYPGEGFLDWIKLTAYNHVATDGTFGDFSETLGIFYGMFHRAAPLMLSTAISHHSPESNSHFPAQASDKLTQIYDLLERHHRIRAIIYRNYSDRGESGHIYSLNTSPILRDAYREAAANPRFISQMPTAPHPRRGNITLHHPNHAISREGSFYVPFEGQMLPIAQVLNRLNGDFFVNKQEGHLTLQVTHWP
ncbi:MAG: hypothetical protein FWB98_00545 [Defluviitaleaceae bacterium]|nr:hypothetical protein [Defluviitaleaceae bacterium]